MKVAQGGVSRAADAPSYCRDDNEALCSAVWMSSVEISDDLTISYLFYAYLNTPSITAF